MYSTDIFFFKYKALCYKQLPYIKFMKIKEIYSLVIFRKKYVVHFSTVKYCTVYFCTVKISSTFTSNHSQSGYKVIKKGSEKRNFWKLGKIEKIKFFTQYTQFTTRRHFGKIVQQFFWKLKVYINFLFCLKSCYKNILLTSAGWSTG